MRSVIANRKSQIANAGFSLVEVLVAVLILAILVAAASRGLVTSLATDSVSRQLFEGNLVMNRIETARLRGAISTEQLKPLTGPGWALSESLQEATKTNSISWRTLTLQSELRPSLRLQHVTRATK